MTATTQNGQWIAFAGQRKVAFGQPRAVASAVKSTVTQNPDAQVLVFDARSSEAVEIDLRGSEAEVLARLPVEAEAQAPAAEVAAEATPAAPRLPGRPKLGVVAREVTLLPRHCSGSPPGLDSDAWERRRRPTRRRSRRRRCR